MRFFSYDGKAAQFILLMARMTLMTLIWFAGCIPVVTGGASSVGMYYALNRYREGDVHLFENYKLGAKTHWKRATLFWVLCLAVGIGLFCEWFFFDFTHFLDYPALLVAAVLAVAAFSFMALWFYPVMVNFRGSFGELIGNAFLFSIIYTPYTLVTIALYAGLLYLLNFPIVFGVCCIFAQGLIAYAGVLMYEKAFRKYRKGLGNAD